jgi:hypothetical protein
LDNWIIAMPGGEDGLELHQQITHKFLDLLQHLSYFLKLGKCEFKHPHVEFLGWLVTLKGVIVNLSKVVGLTKWPCQLCNIKELCHTLGILGYQQLFIKGYAQLAKPLTNLTKKGVPFCWTDKYMSTLDCLIHMVTTAPVLGCPDPKKQYWLEVDASAFALEAMLI